MDHDERVRVERNRFAEFNIKSAKLRDYVVNAKSTIIETIASEAKIQQKYTFLNKQADKHLQRCQVSHSNMADFSRLYPATYTVDGVVKRVFCRVIDLQKVDGDFAFRRLPTCLAICKFFSGLKPSSYGSHSPFFTLLNAFEVNSKIFIYHERFNVNDSMMHRLHNDDLSVSLSTECISQLVKAVEFLNSHGVAHRFIRGENVLLHSINDQPVVRVTAFDMACLFWDPTEGSPMLSIHKGIPSIGHVPLLAHLPPEAFENNYDCSMVDVWSIAVLGCLLLVGENPFEDGDRGGVVELVQWKHFGLKKFMPDQIRSLFDDIFVHTDARMTAFDFAQDRRLGQDVDAKAFTKMQLAPYYRIDLIKVIETTEIGNLSL